MMDKSRYTAAEQEYYEVDGSNVYEGSYKGLIDTLGNLKTEPVDSATRPRKYDQRDKPEVGY
jgi:hypothetical protein